jgi:hypothetical protein
VIASSFFGWQVRHGLVGSGAWLHRPEVGCDLGITARDLLRLAIKERQGLLEHKSG